MKVCTRCQQEKPLDDFRDVKRRDRVEKHSWCHACLRANQAAQYVKHRDKRRAEQAARRAANPGVDVEKRREADRRRRAARTVEQVKEASRATWLRRLRMTFGITEADYDAMLHDQGGCCALCGADNPGREGRWPVDHDHRTGRIRGLLCHPCNQGIGLLRDDPHLLRQAATYVERHALEAVS